VLEQYVSPQVAQSGAPRGEVTLVFTDIEGSSLLSERFGAAFEKARAAHFQLLREAARRWNGFEVETAGDSLFVVFADPADAVRFAVAGQLALKKHRWPSFLREARQDQESWAGFDLPVRMGMHTGRPFIERDRNRLTYRGPDTNRAGRVMSAGHGGHILLSQTTFEKVADALKADAEFSSVHYLERGVYRFKGIGEVKLWEACHPQLFDPPPRPLREDIMEETVAESSQS
jgi:class 3 adenylate cyclase